MSDEKNTGMRLPGNSYTNRKQAKEQEEAPERPKLEKVTTSGAAKRKPSNWGKLKESMAGDDARSVGNYIIFEVAVPAAKAMFLDAVSQGFERLLYGDTSRGRTRPTQGGVGSTRYSRNYRQASSGGPGSSYGGRQVSKESRARHDFDEIVIAERGEAQEVLDSLIMLVEEYGHARVSDLYTLVGISDDDYTDLKWGWTDLHLAKVLPTRGGYILDLPATEAIR